MGGERNARPVFDYDPDDEADSETRARMPTVTDELALEQARLASMPTSPPNDAIAIATLRERLAPIDRVPRLAQSFDRIRARLDPKTVYILGFVDGVLPLETIVDVAGLPEREALEVLHRMVVENVIVFPT